MTPGPRWLALAFVLSSIAATAQTTFTNSSTILLPAPPGTGSTSNAVPGEPGSLYPSPIVVSGMGSSISKVTVTISDFRHVFPDDVDMLLVGPAGQKMLIWSDVGGLNSTCGPSFDFLICNNQAAPGSTGPTIVLDDAAAADLASVSTLASGTFKPTNVGNATDMFPAPAPSAPFGNPRPDGVATLASVFNGTNPNGTWNLYVIDDAQGATGRISGGWRLTITTTGGTAPAPDLRIAKTHAGNFVRGQVGAAYTISVTNAGAAATSGTVSVADSLPAGLTATSIAGAGWACAQPAGPCTRSTALSPGASFPAITLTVNVASDAPASVTNTASVSGGGDGNAANNSASDPTTIAGGARVLDIDDNGTYDALTDGLLVSRYLFGLTGSGLTNGALGANARRTDPGQVLAYLADIRPRLDIDGNGDADALTDGLMALRYLFGLRGTQLTQGAIGPGATRTAPQIEAYIQSLMP